MISNIVTKKFKLLFSLILVLAIALHPAFAVTSYADTFSDVKYEDWFYNSVDYVSDANCSLVTTSDAPNLPVV